MQPVSILAPGKFRQLSPVDKKQIGLFRAIIDEIGKEIALRSNNLDVVFATLRGIAKDIPPNDAEGIYSVTAAHLQKLQDVINLQEKAFRDDPLGIYQFELDDDLLFPISHECLSLWNRVEGFSTVDYIPPTEEVRAKKKSRVEQAKARKEQAAEKQRDEKKEKDNQREADKQRKEEIKKLALFHEAETVDDKAVINPRELGFVDYSVSSLPLGDQKEFSRALDIWTIIVSIPQVFKLSQYSLTMFVTSLQDDDEPFLMQETCRMLVQVGAKVAKTAGRNWFDQLRDYLSAASGAKKKAAIRKKTLAQKRKRSKVVVDDDDDDDEDDDDDDDDDDDTSSEEPEEEEIEDADEDAVEEEIDDTQEDIDFASDFAKIMKDMEESKAKVTWAHLEVHDRLVLLKYLVDSVLESSPVIKEADAVAAADAASEVSYEKTIKEHREECEKELKSASRKKPGEVDLAVHRDACISKMKKDMGAAFSERMEDVEKKDVGARIMPLGEDRYGRLFWRFPLESCIYVQTTATTKDFPIVSKPKVKLLDEEDTPKNTPTAAVIAEGQKEWGKIAPADIEQFLASLEVRGHKENALKKNLDRYVAHLLSLAVPLDRVRITRFRTSNKGYNNKLNIPAMLPY